MGVSRGSRKGEQEREEVSRGGEGSKWNRRGGAGRERERGGGGRGG